MATTNCPHCGNPCDGSEKFCASCGKQLSDSPDNQFSVLSEKSTSYTYQPLPIFFWIKGSVELDDRIMTVHEPHVFLKVFPLGSSDWSAPIQTISGINYHDHLFIGRLVGGALVTMLGLTLTLDLLSGNSPLSGFVGLILALTGISMILSSWPAILEFEKSGIKTAITVPNYQHRVLTQIKSDLEQRTMRNNTVAANAHIAQELDRNSDRRNQKLIDAINKR